MVVEETGVVAIVVDCRVVTVVDVVVVVVVVVAVLVIF